jgi:hypothetical protein
MSDLPAGALDYRAVVTEYFLGLRRSGLMLSPLDQEVVLDWERRGVPVAIVCRGLRRGVEDLAEHGIAATRRAPPGVSCAPWGPRRLSSRARAGPIPARATAIPAT